MAALLQAASAAGVDILTSAKVTTLFVDESRRVSGVAYERPDGTTEEIGCAALIPACSGFGGNPDMEFDDYRNAFAHGAVQQGKTLTELASRTGLPIAGIEATFADVADFAAARRADPFGRDFTRTGGLVAPFFAVKVTGALFHTQGGLVVNDKAQVIDRDGKVFPNLFAGGGAARGVSGAHVWGYLSGNGLLTAVTLGFIAGQSAAAQVT